MDIAGHLVTFARGQLAVLGKPDGPRYVRRCLVYWEERYGDVIAEQVKAELNKKGKE